MASHGTVLKLLLIDLYDLLFFIIIIIIEIVTVCYNRTVAANNPNHSLLL